MNPFPNVPVRFGRRTLPLAVATALGIAAPIGVGAQLFPAEFELSGIDGQNGFVIDGETRGDYSGYSVSTAGDVNGDGFVDLVIGAYGADPNGNASSGRSYVVFGTGSALPSPFDLSTLNGLNGFSINGEATGDESGSSVSGVGDINGDGFDDLLIGAQNASPNGLLQAGRSYLVFGSPNLFPNPFELSGINALNGFVLNGEFAGDRSGYSTSAAGDVNGDGIDDLVIGAPFAYANGIPGAGRAYVVFGSDQGLPNPFNLATLNGVNGFVLNGAAVNDETGNAVAAAGDINGDGIGDLIIGARAADPNGSNSGRSYVVLGSDSGFPHPFDLSSLDGTNGFVLNGEAAGDRSGFDVSGAGDVNGDGLDDLVIGARGADPNALSTGRSYVVFGSSGPFAASLDLSTLNGVNGFMLDGENEFDISGNTVAGLGDINGDGIDDLAIGARNADPSGDYSGRTYVIFGSTGSYANPFSLASLNGSNGFFVDGENIGDISSISISTAGDFNVDGVDDFIVGASRANPDGRSNAGRSYVVFGRADFDIAVRKTNGAGYVAANEPVTYLIDAVNFSSVAVHGATLTDILPDALDAGTASWSCSGSGGAVCPNPAGSGNLVETVDLPPGGMLSYQLTAMVLAPEGVTVTNTATIVPPLGIVDISPGNNSSTDRDPVALFADGGESE